MAKRTGTGGRWLRYATLFSGLGTLFIVGAWVSPLNAAGDNVFLGIANQRDVLSYVSVTGILAVGMTLVILTAGIDLSVGSVMSLCTVVCAMLLMQRPGDFETVGRAHLIMFSAVTLFAGGIGYWVVSKVIDGLAGSARGTATRGATGDTTGDTIRAAGFSPRRRPRGLKPAALKAIGALAGALLALQLVSRSIPTGFSTLAVLLVVPPVGGMMGLLSGLIIAKTRLQPFIVTLAMMISAVGLAKFVAGHGGQIHAIYKAEADLPGAPASFEQLGQPIITVGTETLRSGAVRDVKLLPIPGLFLLGCWGLAAFVLRLLPLGRYIYAVGGNEETSRLCGVPVDRVKVFVYTAGGLLAGLAAVLYCAMYQQGKADAGQMKELDAIAAVVIGGTSLMGGRGGIVGTLVGVMIFGYLTNILQLKSVSSEIQDIVKGVIIVGAAALQSGHVAGMVRSLVRRRVKG
ncbi:MAG: ABC transporter permease [Planctomycetes bacterium]|nr:ABC transporter permease [Planctomycetota bacterium]